MSKRGTTPKKSGTRFDPLVFLKTAAQGRTVSTYQKKQIIFAQGDTAGSVHYIQSGKVKVTVISDKARKPLSQSWGKMSSLVRDA